MTRSARPGTAVVVLLALLGGYVAFDAFDAVPGMLTTSDPWPEPAPFPTAPGAVEVAPPETVFPSLPQSAPVPDAGEIESRVAELVGDERLGSRVGVVVADAITGETLGAEDEDRLMTPASAQKILTGVAALSSPLADRTLATTVVRSENTVTLVGGGDMMLAAGKGKPDEVNGHAGLADLADQVAGALRADGTGQVRLAVDDTLFSGPGVAPAVPKANMAYIGEAAPLGVNIGLAGDAYSPSGPWVEDPAKRAGEILAGHLRERGIEVTNVARGTAPESAEKIGEVRSAPVAEITEFFLHTSNNTMTEVVCRLVAVEAGRPGSNEAGTDAVTAAVQGLGVDLDGADLKDCSGLGDGSRLSARQLAAVVELTIDPAHSELRDVAVGMPIGGLSGTLYDRFSGDNPARGLVRAKTGSLSKTRALAGTVVTADQRQLVFVVLADSIPGYAEGAVPIYDAFVGSLAAYSVST
ncbi:D-alanyl-D-alanine carboxypeptidase/D-alanyl-D-alanine endopeptidase [Myceligenerans xiligouense]|uniref:D-alanyl-D-alanine carboxypeptidase/D-alanyl-D-alanine-endopeptidase (Penicillin-binding protein 4) n=1 Tax=Myceligenerans xiligouense TaxID=253184 RepID=A0A3N4Z100_9MICO|nr:D-alanyl-D-alanine carboxypeptidase/D-alanyl-D-alanine-endopeptidase [Myceligenerans xiligouense]RPF19768.1 D-alanyl-D-alanine carboxypeptidase/D-alanyl-D-alanine-endopeptidase (penicillin-binding protein 4) [Myceligenerans xiligouense]